jgi:hypothetical protein
LDVGRFGADTEGNGDLSDGQPLVFALEQGARVAPDPVAIAVELERGEPVDRGPNSPGGDNGGVRYQNCPNARLSARRAACIALAAPWFVGKPTRTAGARQRAKERKRRGSKAIGLDSSLASLLTGISCIRRA